MAGYQTQVGVWDVRVWKCLVEMSRVWIAENTSERVRERDRERERERERERVRVRVRVRVREREGERETQSHQRSNLSPRKMQTSQS